MRKPLTIILAISFFAMAVLTVGVLLLYKPGKGGILPNLGQAPEFSLTDATNQIFSSKDLEGKIWVADFFFSTCAGPCPTMGANMQKIHNRFPDEKLRLVNFTVYPSHDTPEVMARYGAKFKADLSRWHFLTGEAEELLRISVKGFKIGDPEELFNHSRKFVLVDGTGAIRGYYDGTLDDEVEELMRAIQTLM